MLRKCPRCQRAFQPEEEDQAYCKSCLRHYMPHQDAVNPMGANPKIASKGRTINQILQSGKERSGAKEALDGLK